MYACPHPIQSVVSAFVECQLRAKNQTDPSISSGDIIHKWNPAN